MVRPRSKVRPDELARLHLPVSLHAKALQAQWLATLEDADTFVGSCPADQTGCLYYSSRGGGFVQTTDGSNDDVVPHYGRPGGVLPRALPASPE